jgi:hypothetical protein
MNKSKQAAKSNQDFLIEKKARMKNKQISLDIPVDQR